MMHLIMLMPALVMSLGVVESLSPEYIPFRVDIHAPAQESGTPVVSPNDHSLTSAALG